MFRPKYFLFFLCSIFLIFLLYYFLFSAPIKNRYIVPSPELKTTQKLYDYYEINDEKDNTMLMRIPVVVTVGDELITEDNKLYRVTKIEENQAYAKFIKNITLP